MIKIILSSLLSTVIVAILAVMILLWSINLNDYKQEIEEIVAEQGIELQLIGDLGWSFYPKFGIRSGKFSAKPPISELTEPVLFDSLHLFVKLKPLIKQEIEVQTVRLSGGKIKLQLSEFQQINISDLSLTADGFNLSEKDFPLLYSLNALINTKDPKTSENFIQKISLDSDFLLAFDKKMHKTRVTHGKHKIQYSDHSLPKPVNITASTPGLIDLYGRKVDFNPFIISIDNTDFHGKVSGSFSGIPYLKINLAGNTLLADDYLNKQNGQTKPANTPAISESGDKQFIPTESIMAVPGEYKLTLEKLVASGLTLTDLVFDAHISQSGVLTLNQFSSSLYEGALKLNGVLDMRTQTPNIELNSQLTPIQVEPLYIALIGSPAKDTKTPEAFISGDLAMAGTFTTHGNTQEQLTRALSGELDISSSRLEVNMDITESLDATLLQLLQAKIPKITNSQNKTVMTNMLAINKIKQGVVINEKFSAKSLCTKLSGRGNVHLIDGNVDYRLGIIFPSTDPNPTCEEVNPRLKDTAWPVICRGNISDDPASLCQADKAGIQKVLQKTARKEVNKKVEKKIDDKLREKFGDGADEAKQILKGLFGN